MALLPKKAWVRSSKSHAMPVAMPSKFMSAARSIQKQTGQSRNPESRFRSDLQRSLPSFMSSRPRHLYRQATPSHAGTKHLVVTEMTAVSENGRITPFCPGLYSDDQVAAWRHIADFVHANSTAKLCVQLGHAGPRGATQAGSIQPDRPLTEGAWPLLAASAQSYKPDGQVPQASPAAPDR